MAWKVPPQTPAARVSPTTWPARRIISLAARYKLPAVYFLRRFVSRGGLMSYGPDIVDQYKGAASYVDRILKGADPGVLPIEQPIKFNLAVNLKAAKTLNIAIPESVMLRAGEVIR